MQKAAQVILERVASGDIIDFQKMVDAYWQELMPHSPMVKDMERRNAYFRKCFTWEGGNRHPYWAVVDGRRVGFVSFEVALANKSASVDDFYVALTERRKGYGSA